MNKHLILIAFAALACPLIAEAKPPVFDKPLHFSPDGKKAYGREIPDKAARSVTAPDAGGGDDWLCCWVVGKESQRQVIHKTDADGRGRWEETCLEWSPDSRYLSFVLTLDKYESFMVIDLDGPKGPETVADSWDVISGGIGKGLTGAKPLSWGLQWTAGSDLDVQVVERGEGTCHLLFELRTGRIVKLKDDGSREEVRPVRPPPKRGFWQRLFKKPESLRS